MNEACITLNSGCPFYFSYPERSNFTIEDIAHSLSLICRFAGQCNQFYSVAEHSVYVCEEVQEDKLSGLLHDAAEAFIGDVSRPLKRLLPDYQVIEKQVERVVFERFGLTYPIPIDVHKADTSVMVAEMEQIMPQKVSVTMKPVGVSPANITVKCLSSTESKRLFLNKFYELTGK